MGDILFEKKYFKNFDYPLLIVVLTLIGFGMLMIYSATGSTSSEGEQFSFMIKQIISFVIGLIFIILILIFDYNYIGKFYWYFYGISIVILIVVKFFGTEINGAKSWMQFGTFTFQPSEFSKILIILFLAKVLSDLKEQGHELINYPVYLAKVIGLLSVPLILILLQPDFGTAMVLLFIIAVMLFAAKLSYKYFLGAGLAVLATAPIAWFFILKEYQKDRIRVFLNPETDPLNKGFQVIQSKMAIGSGGLYGKGIFQGIQTQMGLLPFKETDFIFSVVGEELGFIFSIIIVLLFGFILLRLIDTARNSKDFFGSMIVIGITAMIGIHAFQNIGMTIGLMPVTGIPLPFISAGGTSLMANMIGIGIVLNVSMRRQKITF